MRMVVLVLVIGCGSGGSVPISPDIDAGPPIDAVAIPDARPDPLHVGRISIAEESRSGSDTTLHSARLSVFPDVLLRQRDDGACNLQFLEIYVNEEIVLAGTIVIDGPSAPPITLMPAPGGGYMSDVSGSLRHAQDDVLAVTAEGAAVPAFASTVTFPAPLTIIDPPVETSLTLNKSGFTATWMPTASTVRILIIQHPDMNHQTRIECVFDGATGSAILSKTVLAPLEAEFTTDPTILTISTLEQTRLVAGDHDIAIEAEFVGFRGSVDVQ